MPMYRMIRAGVVMTPSSIDVRRVPGDCVLCHGIARSVTIAILGPNGSLENSSETSDQPAWITQSEDQGAHRTRFSPVPVHQDNIRELCSRSANLGSPSPLRSYSLHNRVTTPESPRVPELAGSRSREAAACLKSFDFGGQRCSQRHTSPVRIDP